MDQAHARGRIRLVLLTSPREREQAERSHDVQRRAMRTRR